MELVLQPLCAGFPVRSMHWQCFFAVAMLNNWFLAVYDIGVRSGQRTRSLPTACVLGAGFVHVRNGPRRRGTAWRVAWRARGGQPPGSFPAEAEREGRREKIDGVQRKNARLLAL